VFKSSQILSFLFLTTLFLLLNLDLSQYLLQVFLISDHLLFPLDVEIIANFLELQKVDPEEHGQELTQPGCPEGNVNQENGAEHCELEVIFDF
jgi:hypothetical protein